MMVQPRPPKKSWPFGERLLVSVLTELGSGRITEAPIQDAVSFTSGLCEGRGHITVDPDVDLVMVLLHELLHRLHPAWSERGVDNLVMGLMRRLTEAQMRQIAVEYHKRKVVRKRPKVMED
jgi:hypothetical protein